MERRADRYRWHLLVQARERTRLQTFLRAWLPQLAALKSSRRVRWSVDVDPQELL
jgi:primosomal protein N' (replication factor Y)